MSIGIERLVLTYILYVILLVFFLKLLIKVMLKQEKTILNSILKIQYLFAMSSFIFALFIPICHFKPLFILIVFVSHMTVKVSFACAIIFLLTLYEGGLKLNKKVTFPFLILYLGIFMSFFFIPEAINYIESEITFQVFPVYNLPFTLAYILFLGATFSIIVILGRKVLGRIEGEDMRKKFKKYLIGYSGLAFIGILFGLDNYLIQHNYFITYGIGDLLFLIYLLISVVVLIAILLAIKR